MPHSMKKFVGGGLLAFCLAVVLGCAPGVETPETAVLGLGGVRFEGLGATATLKMRIGNPNPDPLLVEGVRFKLLANGTAFAKGMGEIKTEIPSFGHEDVEIPATIANLALVRAAVSTTSAGRLDYRMDATVTFKNGAGKRFTRAVGKEGSLDAAPLVR
ncbi:MAG: LEA type 2 family protein [Planctomycetota bacterium]